MKKYNLALTALPLFTIILESLPYGAVLNFASPDSEPVRQTYSYFDLTPFGYANFGPLLTAMLTVVLFILSLIYLIKSSNGVRKTIMIISIIAVLTSLMPILYGLKSYSIVGAIISIVLLLEFILSIKKCE